MKKILSHSGIAMEKIRKIKINPNIVENIFIEMSKNYKEIVKDYIDEFNKRILKNHF